MVGLPEATAPETHAVLCSQLGYNYRSLAQGDAVP